MPLTAGATLGPYEILARAGAGGMGEVYKARDTRLNRTVAIKVLPAALTADPDARQRLDREAKAVAALSHPHICALFDIGHQVGTDFLVMEFLEGETLAERLTRGKLPLDEALRTGIQIASPSSPRRPRRLWSEAERSLGLDPRRVVRSSTSPPARSRSALA